MTSEIKKIIAGIITGGALIGGGTAVVNKLNCEYVIQYEGKEICFDKEVKAVLDDSIKKADEKLTQEIEKSKEILESSKKISEKKQKEISALEEKLQNNSAVFGSKDFGK